LENDPPTRRELLREAKTLAEGTVNDIPLAEEVLRELLDEDEADTWALEELTKLRQNAGDAKEVVTLLMRRAELAQEPEATELKHRAAKGIVDQLGDVPRAIQLYEEILGREPTDTLASASLRGLYMEEG